MKQQQTIRRSSASRGVSDQDGCPGSTNASGDQQQQPEKPDEDKGIHCPAEPLDLDGQVALAVAQLEGLPLYLASLTQSTGGDVVEGGSGVDKDGSSELPVSPFEDPEGGSQTSSEVSWASFPSSSSHSTDSSDGDGDASGAVTSPAATFKFHEELEDEVVDDDDGVDDCDNEPESAPGEPFMEEDSPCPVYDELWLRPIPRWSFIQSSHSLPIHGLGPEDLYHGGSGLRHEVSATEEDEDEEGEDGWLREISTVEVVYL